MPGRISLIVIEKREKLLDNLICIVFRHAASDAPNAFSCCPSHHIVLILEVLQ